MRRAIYVGLLLLAAHSPAAANGGPVEWTQATVVGGFRPTTETQVQLVREDLDIRLADDLRYYQVRARYLLSNPKRARKVRWGVPVAWPRVGFDGEVSLAEEARTYVHDIRIELGGRHHPCKYGPVAPFDVRNAPGTPLGATALCVAELSIPKGRQVVLTLSYRGEYEFEDSIFSKSPRVSFGERWLRYALAPAGYWAGPTRRVRIRVDTGVLEGMVKSAAPAGWKLDGRFIRWDLASVDLRQVPTLQLQLDAYPLLEHQELVRWKHREWPRVEASVQVSDGRPGALLDADGGTAWCSRRKRPWVEVSFREDPTEALSSEHLRSIRVALVPGHTRSADLYRDHGRVAQVRIGTCERGSPTSVHTIVLADRHDRSGRLLRLDDEAVSKRLLAMRTDFLRGASKVPPCIRIEVLKAARGKKHSDVCLSEVFPVVDAP